MNAVTAPLVEANICEGVKNNVFRKLMDKLKFPTDKTIGDTFKSCGFEMNVIDSYSITLTHNNLHSLVKDLRIMGETSNFIDKANLENSEKISERILWLPSSNNLKENEILEISEIISSKV